MTEKSQELVEKKEIVEIKEFKAELVFNDKEKLQEVLNSFKVEVDKLKQDRDATTEAGRKKINSNARKLGGLCTKFDGYGKELVEGIKKSVKGIDENRKIAREFIDALKVEYRKPLTEFEEQEAKRVGKHETALERLKLQLNTALYTLDDCENMKNVAKHIYSEHGDWEEFDTQAKAVRLSINDLAEEKAEAIAKKDAEDKAEKEAIAKKAAEEATAKAEKAAQAKIDEANQRAIEAELAAEEAKESTPQPAPFKPTHFIENVDKPPINGRVDTGKTFEEVLIEEIELFFKGVPSARTDYELSILLIDAIKDGRIKHLQIV